MTPDNIWIKRNQIFQFWTRLPVKMSTPPSQKHRQKRTMTYTLSIQWRMSAHTLVLSQTLVLTLTLSPSCSIEHAWAPLWWHNIKWTGNPRLHTAQQTNKGLRKCSSGRELLFAHSHIRAFTWMQGGVKYLQHTHTHKQLLPVLLKKIQNKEKLQNHKYALESFMQN